jgi:hypothetical protein
MPRVKASSTEVAADTSQGTAGALCIGVYQLGADSPLFVSGFDLKIVT